MVEGNGVKCPECSGRVNFQGRNIVCLKCRWHPPDTVMKMYGLAPITNRRIMLGSALVFAMGLASYALQGAAAFLILGFIGLAFAPLLLAYRSWYVERLMRNYQGIQS